MGAGKSSIGRALAKRIRHRFVDLDQVIVKRVGKSVQDIFDQEGKEAFRTFERKALSDVMRRRGAIVVALGGGSLQNQRIVKRVKKAGTLVFVDLPATELAERLGRSRTKRPLLYNSKGEKLRGDDLLRKIEWLLRRRQHLYEQAHVRLKPGVSPDASAELLEKSLASLAL